MREFAFNEETMRQFADLNSAIKQYSSQGFSRRRIVALYNQTFTIAIGNISVNVRFLKSETGAKFIETRFGKSETRLKALETAVKTWNERFKGSDFAEVKKSSRTKISSEAKPLQTDTNEVQPEA